MRIVPNQGADMSRTPQTSRVNLSAADYKFNPFPLTARVCVIPNATLPTCWPATASTRPSALALWASGPTRPVSTSPCWLPPRWPAPAATRLPVCTCRSEPSAAGALGNAREREQEALCATLFRELTCFGVLKNSLNPLVLQRAWGFRFFIVTFEVLRTYNLELKTRTYNV